MMTRKDLYWQNDTTPASRRYNDIYFSVEDGFLESRHVYLNAINIPEIWRNKKHFTLLENGFGCGLNFSITCLEWLKTSDPDSRMTYIATEKYPLRPEDIKQALSPWPELNLICHAVLEKYPPSIKGSHTLDIFEGRIRLLLLFGESETCLAGLDAAADSSVDAIYLDGFTPSRNPDMWSGDVFAQIARLAAPHARLATFTAAGIVRRGLQKVGFKMEKTAGFGKKRESMRGVYRGQKPSVASSTPWFQRPEPLPKAQRIAVIGTGIAGLILGRALQGKGYDVTLYERDSCPMNQASGNPAAILDPYLSMSHGPDGVFYHAALLYALDYYNALDPEIFISHGLIKYPTTEREKKKFQKILDQEILPKKLMSAGEDHSLYFPTCGAISPAKIRDSIAPTLTIKSGVAITALKHGSLWTLFCEDTPYDEVDCVVVCGGPNSLDFKQTSQLPLTSIRGQISLLKIDNDTKMPEDVLCAKAYLIPPFDLNGQNTVIAGATFSRHDNDITLRPEDHAENLKNARILWPAVDTLTVMDGRCSIRAATPDHLPLCGAVGDVLKYRLAYQMLKHGPKYQNFKQAPYHPHLYTLSGLGARGFLSAPLLAKMLCAIITGDPLPVPRGLYESLHPARFLIRELIKG